MNTLDTTNAPAPDRHLRITWLADRAGLRIEGELDRAGLPALERVLASMANGGAGFCVDLSGLAFIDSGCMRALVNTGAALHEGGGDQILALQSVPPQMRRLFELIGWDQVPGLRLQATAYPG